MHVYSSTEARLRQLDEWMRSGWEIEEPVLQRNAYHSIFGCTSIFEVIVARSGIRSVIALQDEPDVRRFLTQRHLMIVDAY